MLPNIVLLLADQLRPDFLGCYGANFVKTPTIDNLANRGIRYETAVSPCPLCVPARATLLTGQPAHASGVMHNLAWLRPDRKAMGVYTWAEQLQAVGYQTAAMGKMHFYPWDLQEGFQKRIIAEDKRHIAIKDDYHDALIGAGYRKLHGRDQLGYVDKKGASINLLPDALQVDRWVTNQTVDYLGSVDGGKPFALMVGFPGPHCPYDPPAEALQKIGIDALPEAVPCTEESRNHLRECIINYKAPWADLDYSDLSKAEIRVIRHHYAALVERLDADVNTILEALIENNQLDNTIIVFASDHGDYLGDFGLMGKTTFHEPSIRVPLIVTDFRHRIPKINTSLVSLLDLYPSILKWSEIAAPGYAKGVALDDAVEGRCIVGVTTRGTMVRDSRWKLVRYTNGAEALYDLENDPEEQLNQIDHHPSVRQRLDAELTQDLLLGIGDSNVDKQVLQAKSASSHEFFEREWQRPYPAQHI